MCFFSDGLPEARTEDGLLGRERLVETLDALDSPVTAPRLLQRVRAEALATPDDMVADVISPRVGDTAPASAVEELEVDARTPDGGYVGAFLKACGVGAEHIPSLVARAHDTADRGGGALVRVERAPGGDATAAVLPVLSTGHDATAFARPSQYVEPAALLAPRG